MKVEEFLKNITESDHPSSDLSAPLQAMWWAKKGDWERAHSIAQEVHDPSGSWVHAYLHRVEGDLGNASYWYARRGQACQETGGLGRGMGGDGQVFAFLSGEIGLDGGSVEKFSSGGGEWYGRRNPSAGDSNRLDHSLVPRGFKPHQRAFHTFPLKPTSGGVNGRCRSCGVELASRFILWLRGSTTRFG